MSKLKTYCYNITDGEHGSVKDDKNGRYFLLSNKNIINGEIVFDDFDRKISEIDFNTLKKRSKLGKNDVVISSVGTIGKTAVVKEEKNFVFQRSVGIIKPNPQVLNPFYFKYLLDTPFFQKKLKFIANGGLQKGLYIDDLENLEIDYLPNINIQRNIVRILKLMDDKIIINNHINKTLEELAKTIYDYWFLQFEFPNEEGRPYKSSGGKMVYNEQLKREIPEGWEVKTLKNSRLFSIIKQGVEYFSKKIYLATANVIGNDIIDGNVVDYENREGRANMQPTLNSVWFAKMKNSIKHIFISKSDNWMIDKYVISTGFMGLQCGENSFPYIVGFISSKYFEKLKDYRSGGSTQEGINEEDLNLFPIIEPTDDILIKYANLVTSLIEKLNKNRKENQELSSLRDFLLPLLMNGQVTFNEENYKLDNEIKQVIAKPYIDGYNQWKRMQGYAARGEVDDEILKQIYDAMDEYDKK